MEYLKRAKVVVFRYIIVTQVNFYPLYQIEGGFVMGVGYVTSEKLKYDKGRLETDGTWEYKPPCSKSIPKVYSSDVREVCGIT